MLYSDSISIKYVLCCINFAHIHSTTKWSVNYFPIFTMSFFDVDIVDVRYVVVSGWMAMHTTGSERVICSSIFRFIHRCHHGTAISIEAFYNHFRINSVVLFLSNDIRIIYSCVDDKTFTYAYSSCICCITQWIRNENGVNELDECKNTYTHRRL